jgi:hypothetical protein
VFVSRSLTSKIENQAEEAGGGGMRRRVYAILKPRKMGYCAALGRREPEILKPVDSVLYAYMQDRSSCGDDKERCIVLKSKKKY